MSGPLEIIFNPSLHFNQSCFHLAFTQYFIAVSHTENNLLYSGSINKGPMTSLSRSSLILHEIYLPESRCDNKGHAYTIE
jgi:hypothetical protein